MSFSTDIKKELNKSSQLANKDLVKYELIGYLISSNTNIVDKNIKYTTESDYNINRFSKLLSNLDIQHKIDITGKLFSITAKTNEFEIVDIQENNIYAIQEKDIKEENKRAIIKGAFMGAGSINNPENKYHLEIIVSNEINLDYIIKLIKDLQIKPKKLIAKNRYSLYIKEGDEISDFLALIGANKAVMDFQDIRIKREMRGKVNRLVNCESANLNKTINASIEQIEAIEKLKNEKRFSKLNENLKEIALLRLENPNVSLIELGKMLENPVGKSGVNYRMKKIIEIANETKKDN